MIWACNLCRKKQEILAKTGQWYHGGMAKPVALDVGDTASGSETASVKTDTSSPPHEKRPKMLDSLKDSGQSSEKENVEEKPTISRTGSLMGKELKRQYSMSEVHSGKVSDDPKDRGSASTSIATTQDRGGMSLDQDKLRERGQLPERGRRVEKAPAQNRYHSESRIPDGKMHSRAVLMDEHTVTSPTATVDSRSRNANTHDKRHSSERDKYSEKSRENSGVRNEKLQERQHHKRDPSSSENYSDDKRVSDRPQERPYKRDPQTETYAEDLRNSDRSKREPASDRYSDRDDPRGDRRREPSRDHSDRDDSRGERRREPSRDRSRCV